MVRKSSSRFYGWSLELGRVEYAKTLEWQHGLVKMREQGLARDTIITVEHPSVITVGRDGHEENYRDSGVEPIFVERGGDVTYHGPGQLVIYFIFNLTRRGRDLHKFMDDIQQGIIAALAGLGIQAGKGTENTGVWVGDRKIASIGVAVKHWISFHGAAVNLNTELNEFGQINPCGLDAAVMTSAEKLTGHPVDFSKFSHAVIESYQRIFETQFVPVKLEEFAEALESQAGGYEI
ncbi:MAG TPA: lipoyl(octanoyl) transferase LipB [Candidatus Acidoferrum sp.]|nr:lipoyl(octanoyl) transferase LipB [Candidatus Acidoferrum sp.]